MTKEEKNEYIRILNDRKNSLGDIAEKARKYLPSYLYRYRSFRTEYWEDEIFKGKIYLPQADYLNDPMDCLAYFDISMLPSDCNFIQLLKQQYGLSHKDNIDKFKDEDSLREILEDYRLDIRTASFSENSCSLLMWSHYADMHKGFCIEYDTKKLKPLISGKLYPVVYSSIKPNVFEEIKDNTQNAMLKAMVYKAKEWEYENEWRAVSSENKQYVFFQLEAIHAIYFGTKCEAKNKEKVVRWAKQNGKKVYQMKIDLKEYKLIQEQVVP